MKTVKLGPPSSRRNMEKIRDLPLKAKWYDMIEKGGKGEEYREIKPYWVKRFFKGLPAKWQATMDMAIKSNDFTPFYGIKIHPEYTHIRFRRGYTKGTMLFELDYITVNVGFPGWGAPDKDVFVLKLGIRRQ